MINKGWEPDGDRAKWKQIYEELRDRITAGQYEPRNAIPSLTKLEEEFGVTRNTLRKVIRRLAEAQLVRGETGVGTFVRPVDDWQLPPDER